MHIKVKKTVEQGNTIMNNLLLGTNNFSYEATKVMTYSYIE